MVTIEKSLSKEASRPRAFDVAMLGSSSFQLWVNVENALYPMTVKNAGVGGNTLKKALSTIEVDLQTLPAKRYLLYFGDNDTIEPGYNEETFIEQYRQLVRILRSIDQAEIYILAVKPSPARITFWPRVKALNNRLARISAEIKAHFVDTASPLLSFDGNIRPEIYVDGLHLNASGYIIWQNILRSDLGIDEKKTPEAVA